MSRSRLPVNQREPVGLHLAPAQAANLARSASSQQDQPHRRDADRVLDLAPTQDCAELRQVICAKQPPARWTPVADNAGARVSSSFGPMAPRDGAVEQVAQNVVGAVCAARLSASVLVEEASNIGTGGRADAEMAERREDCTVEVAPGCLHRGRLPRGRAPLDVFGGELRQCRTGSGKGHGKGTAAALLAGEEGKRRSPRVIGLHRAGFAERDPARLAVAPEPEHPGARIVGLDAQHEALQGGIVDGVFARARLDRECERIGQAGAFGHRSASPPSSMSARPCETRLAASNTESSARCA